jgi:hypothetical protein
MEFDRRLLRTSEVARQLGKSPCPVRRLAYRGKIRAYRLPIGDKRSILRYFPKDVEAYQAKHPAATK